METIPSFAELATPRIPNLALPMVIPATSMNRLDWNLPEKEDVVDVAEVDYSWMQQRTAAQLERQNRQE